MPDMLVKLYELPPLEPVLIGLQEQGIKIRRALAPDKLHIIEWVKSHSTPFAAGEADVCFSHTPVSLFVATRQKDILGYACYDAIAPDFFGPTRVLDSEQGKQIGKALLLKSLYALQEKGYAYAIIGGVGPWQFYGKCVQATLIEGSQPGIYQDFLGAQA